jgi:Zn finger protein HypA/HybF involved in hydrogenase expression
LGKQKTLEEFINDSIKKHGNKFDYSKVVYKHSKEYVEIGCLICGHWFKQKPSHNLNGRGCPMCARKKQGDTFRLTQEIFLSRCVKTHGDKYDYSLAEYVQTDKKVKILCKSHNEVFEQTPHEHMKGAGCPSCFEERRGKSKQEKASANFLREALEIHGDLYDYSRVKYVLSTEYVEIGCKRCGNYFLQTPSGHKQGYGCTKCAADIRGFNKRTSTQGFVERSQAVHGEGKFLYDRVNYTVSQARVEIGCASCGNYWKVVAYKHLNGFGCSYCAEYGFNFEKPATLYVLQCENITKIGITNREPIKRIKEINKDSGKNFVLTHSFEFERGKECSDLETELLRYLRAVYENPEVKYNGSTESFIDVNLDALLREIRID